MSCAPPPQKKVNSYLEKYILILNHDKVVASFKDVINVSDDVVDGWFLMGSVWPIAAIISVYLIFVLKVGPKFMEKRKPLEMKGIMLAYNLFQVFQNGWLVWLVSTH